MHLAGSTAGDASEGGLTRDGDERKERRGDARGRGPRPETKHERDERRDEWHVERDVPRDERDARERGIPECEGLVRVLIKGTRMKERASPDASTRRLARDGEERVDE